MKIVNPATEEIIGEVQTDTRQTLEKKYGALHRGQTAWSEVSLPERIAIVRKYALLLTDNIETLAAVLTSEVGKPLQQSRNEVNGACARINWLADNASKYLSDEVMGISGGMTEKIVYEPLGVVCNISAWNYPYLVGTNVMVPALLAGNAVLYKPSEYAVLTGMEIEKLLMKAGVPENVFQIAIGAREVGETLLEMPFDGYFFTGSYRTGNHIYEKISARMVPCQCEMGGKDPLYVADDITDIKSVAAGTADGAFYNNGQSCCSVERIYVHEKVYDRYVEEFVKEVKQYKSGSPTAEGVYIGPLTRKEQVGLIQNQVDEAVRLGAILLTGGKRMATKGFYFEPTVLTNVSHAMSVMREESFGPVIGIMKVRSDDEAIQLMNDTEYGLTASVYSSDQKRAENILSSVNSGTGYW
ncbi:MAG TPA: aldehyde dehydrogenase family protein, partial [Cyclobacteriaceae bacterium]|nr:aldehyde dehydrogenase family protein [Cyclobacteriaceae bacterium]